MLKYAQNRKYIFYTIILKLVKSWAFPVFSFLIQVDDSLK